MAGSTAILVRPALLRRLNTALAPPSVGALLGLGAGLLLEQVAQTSPSFDGVLGLAGHLGEPVALLLTTGAGLIIGLMLAASLREEVLRVVVGDRRITMTWADARVSVPRHLVREVVVAEDLVLRGVGTVELARVRCDVDRRHLRAALRRHGYPPPLLDDPSSPQFRRWVTATAPAGKGSAATGAPVGAETRLLLDARARALDDRAVGDAELLRRELTARGMMVRDVRPRGRRTQQQWRTVGLAVPEPPPTAPDAAALPGGGLLTTAAGDAPAPPGGRHGAAGGAPATDGPEATAVPA